MMNPIFPTRYHSRKRLFSNPLFWALLFAAVFPLLMAISSHAQYVLYLFSAYVTVVWLVVFATCFGKPGQSARPMMSSFLLGALVVFPLAYLISNVYSTIAPFSFLGNSLAGVLLDQIAGTALKEEILKLLPVILLAYTTAYFADPFDGIILGIGAGLGFVAVENIMYLHTMLARFTSEEIDAYQMVSQGITRTITLCFLHSAFTGIAGFYFGVFKHKTPRRVSTIIIALAIPIILHGSYNVFVLRFIPGAIIVAIVTCVIFTHMYLREKEHA